MKQLISSLAAIVAVVLTLPQLAAAQTAPAIPSILVTSDTVDTRIGKLEFKDGAPSAETAAKVYDTLDFTRGLDAFLNSTGVHPLMRSGRAFSALAQRTTRSPFTPN